MARVFLTEAAENDLLDIWLYISEDSIRAADNWVGEIEDLFYQLLANPFSGRKRDELAKGLRSFPLENYVTFMNR